MIIDSTSSTKYTIGETTEYKTTIDIENLDFIATLLSSNLYSNPEDSFIREIVSNGWDAHVEAGTTDTPLIVKMSRNSFYDYDITIRDYGTGLSKEEFENLYCKIGSSTKRLSNNYLGCFGLGHLSPLSVSNVVYITSYHNGVARSYIMTKNGNNITTNLMNEISTSEKNGLEITVKNLKNLNVYKQSLLNLAFFPNIYVEGIYDEVNRVKVKRYKYFSVASTDISNKILLGNVLYPLADNIIPSEYSSFYKSLYDSGVVLNFNIGELQVTPNRESIIYNTKTNALIIERLKQCLKEIESIISPNLNKDYTDPYEFYDIKFRNIYYDLLENKKVEYYNSGRIKLDLSWFNLDMSLFGEKDVNLSVISRSTGIFPDLKAVFNGEKFWKDKLPYEARRLRENSKISIIEVDSNLKLTKYIKDYIDYNYNKCLIVSKFNFEDYKQTYMSNYSFTLETNAEKTLKLCYKALKNRCTYIDFETNKEFLEFKKTQQEHNKANKTPDIGKVILNIECSPDEYTYRRSYKRDFISYKEALKFIKSLNKGVLINGIPFEQLDIIATKLGYTVIKVNKKLLDILLKEQFTSKITPDVILNNQKLVDYNTIYKSEFTLSELPSTFIQTLPNNLKEVIKYIRTLESNLSTYNVEKFLQNNTLSVNEDLEETLNLISEYYRRYKELLGESYKLEDSALADFITYSVVKNKLYRVNFNQYNKAKNNKLLQLVCGK